jgi:hypothetical protein
VAHDSYLCCIHAAAGLHEIANLPLRNKPGDKGNFLP